VRWLLLLLLLTSFPASADSWKGVAQIVDGDTLRIDGVKLRLIDVDAFELDQTCLYGRRVYSCGLDAVHYLATLIKGREVACEGDDRDRFGVPQVVCYVEGFDLGQAMVREGWAVPFISHQYDWERDRAQAERRGAWAGRFIYPRYWRAGIRDYSRN
jgi:endonuclease YncB( thermonuclease family)